MDLNEVVLSCRDLVPIIGALENNTWFTKFTASKIRLVGLIAGNKPKSL